MNFRNAIKFEFDHNFNADELRDRVMSIIDCEYGLNNELQGHEDVNQIVSDLIGAIEWLIY